MSNRWAPDNSADGFVATTVVCGDIEKVQSIPDDVLSFLEAPAFDYIALALGYLNLDMARALTAKIGRVDNSCLPSDSGWRWPTLLWLIRDDKVFQVGGLIDCGLCFRGRTIAETAQLAEAARSAEMVDVLCSGGLEVNGETVSESFVQWLAQENGTPEQYGVLHAWEKHGIEVNDPSQDYLAYKMSWTPQAEALFLEDVGYCFSRLGMHGQAKDPEMSGLPAM